METLTTEVNAFSSQGRLTSKYNLVRGLIEDITDSVEHEQYNATGELDVENIIAFEIDRTCTYCSDCYKIIRLCQVTDWPQDVTNIHQLAYIALEEALAEEQEELVKSLRGINYYDWP